MFDRKSWEMESSCHASVRTLKPFCVYRLFGESLRGADGLDARIARRDMSFEADADKDEYKPTVIEESFSMWIACGSLISLISYMNPSQSVFELQLDYPVISHMGCSILLSEITVTGK